MNVMSVKAEYLTVEQIEAIAAVNKNAFTDNNKKVFSAAQLAAATGV